MEVVHHKKSPCEWVINTSKSKTRLMDFARAYNKDKDLRSKQCLKSPLQQTLSRLIYLLAKLYINPDKQWVLRQENISGNLNDLDLALPHSNSYIANYNQSQGKEFKYYSTRTIQNHLNRLELLGLIKQVKYASKKTILIHPDLIEFNQNFKHLRSHFNEYFPYSLKNLITENRALQEQEKKNLPTKYPNLETYNSITIQSNEEQKETSSNHSEPFYLDTRETKLDIFNNNEKLGDKKEKIPPKRKSERESYVQKAIINIWMLIFTKFYKNNYDFIADTQKDIALNYLQNEFETKTASEITIYGELQERVRLWSRFLKADENRFTPLPHAFFTSNQEKGFNQTDTWLKKKKAKIDKNKVIAQARTICRKFKKVYESKEMDPKERIKELKQLEYALNTIKSTNPKVYKEHYNAMKKYMKEQKSIRA